MNVRTWNSSSSGNISDGVGGQFKELLDWTESVWVLYIIGVWLGNYICEKGSVYIPYNLTNSSRSHLFIELVYVICFIQDNQINEQ